MPVVPPSLPYGHGVAAVFDAAMARFAPFEPGPHLAVAVSGGADSLCLALLARDWASAQGGCVTALIVDHGMRAESSEEASNVKRQLAGLHIPGEILTWQGPKPETGKQAAARDARYHLLEAWCRDAGVLHLLVGHHRDDQAETVAIRLERASGPLGLAGMSAVRETRSMRILRPLLKVAKYALCAELSAHGIGWIEDPSNRDRAFARGRLRFHGLDHERLAGVAVECAETRRALESGAAALLARAQTFHAWGYATLNPALWLSAPRAIAILALSRLLGSIGGCDHLPSSDSVGELLARRGGTLAGCRLMAMGEHWLLCRELRGVETSAPLVAGRRFLWDGRFIADPTAAAEGARLVPLGDKGWSDLRQAGETAALENLPHAVRLSLPALRLGFGAEKHVIGPAKIAYNNGVDTDPSGYFRELRYRPRRRLSGGPFAD